MKRSIAFLITQGVILFLWIIFMDFTHITKFLLAFLWAFWSALVAIMYASLWREDINCRCLEKEVKEK